MSMTTESVREKSRFRDASDGRTPSVHGRRMKTSALHTTTPRPKRGPERGWGRPTVPRAMFLVALACRAATVLIAWPVWSVRAWPINVPLLPLPDVSFGPLILLSLIAALVWPRPGVALHAAIYGLSCVFDQYRLQPQFLSLIVL